MAYKLTFYRRRFHCLFGTAYPNIKQLEEYDKRNYVRAFLANVGRENQISLDMDTIPLTLGRGYNIGISSRNPRGYEDAVQMEKTINNMPKIWSFSPITQFKKLLFWRRPTDSFLINDLVTADVVEWLFENVKPNDFQIYTKFDEDISLGFRNPEHATMFKLKFGDADIK